MDHPGNADQFFEPPAFCEKEGSQLVCARCCCRASQYFALSTASELLEVCEQCYLLGCIQNLLDGFEDTGIRTEVSQLLQEAYTLLASFEYNRRVQRGHRQ